jgi:SAM-dependent methyltransferase
MANKLGNYPRHAQYWDWGSLDHDRTFDDERDYDFAKQYGNSILIPMCAWGHLGAYMANHGMRVTAFDITPEMIAEGKKRFSEIGNLNLLVGDIRDFNFDIEPVDVCAFAEMGWLHSIDDVKKALICINNHLRDGGYFILEEFIGAHDSQTGMETFRVKNNPYPDRIVHKTGTTRNEAKTRRCYISQTIYVEHNDGRKEQFDHEFFLQGYTRDEWLAALNECGFEVIGEYKNREKEPWSECDEDWIVETRRSSLIL